MQLPYVGIAGQEEKGVASARGVRVVQLPRPHDDPRASSAAMPTPDEIARSRMLADEHAGSRRGRCSCGVTDHR
jgi:hypothetical protein